MTAQGNTGARLSRGPRFCVLTGRGWPEMVWMLLTLAFSPTAPSLPLLRACTGLFGVNDGSAFALETVF